MKNQITGMIVMFLGCGVLLKREFFIQMSIDRQKRFDRIRGKSKKDYSGHKKLVSFTIPLMGLLVFIVGLLTFLGVLQAK